MTLPADDAPPIANLSTLARSYLASLGVTNPDADADTAGLMWMHALSIGNAPAYLAENADGIRQDFPRVPLPLDHDAFLASVNLGRQIAALLDTDHSVPGISAGTPRTELKAIGAVKRVGGGAIDLTHDATVTVGWGHPGKGNIVMPGKGRIAERPYTDEEREGISAGASDLGLTADNAFDLLGWTTHDVYLNEVAFWSNVPTRVWEYTVGGYQVIKKWFSYREGDLLGRSLTRDEVRDVTHMARRITALLLLEPALDANYQRSKQAALVVGA